MEFKTEAHKAVYGRVKQHVQAVFGEMVDIRSDAPAFAVMKGSTYAQIIVFPWGDDDAVVCVRAYVAYGPDLTPDLLRFLLRENADMRFGAFGIDDDGDVFFEHSIVGSTCDKEELKHSALAVLSTADRYDEEIVERWGGLREADRAKQFG